MFIVCFNDRVMLLKDEKAIILREELVIYATIRYAGHESKNIFNKLAQRFDISYFQH